MFAVPTNQVDVADDEIQPPLEAGLSHLLTYCLSRRARACKRVVPQIIRLDKPSRNHSPLTGTG